MQGFLLDQVGADTRQIALIELGQTLVQQIGHRQIEHRVAQKLQSLIVIGTKTAMGQRLIEQIGIGKNMLQPLLQCQPARIHFIWIVQRI